MDLEHIAEKIRTFRDARDWMKFHNPKNLAISIVLEASELLEHFQWISSEESHSHAMAAKSAIADEMADVAIHLIELANNLDIDLEQAIHQKLDKNATKYPVEKARGNAKKYTEL